MRLKTTFSRATRTATAAFAVALTSGLPANNDFTPAAQAQTANTPREICVAKADIGRWLTDNGQYVLVGADLPVWNQTTHAAEMQRNVFTGDADLQNGYHFRQRPGNQFCTYGETTEIKLFDARKNRIDPRVFKGTMPANAANSLAGVIEKSAALGEYPALQAKIKYNNGTREFMTTVLFNPQTGVGSFWGNDATGQVMDISGGGTVQKASYSQFALSTLDKPVRTAAPK